MKRSRKRQLSLPGLKPREQPAPVRAKKDLSAAAFERALERNGFAHRGPLNFIDATGTSARIFEAVCRVDPLRIARRATLAKLLRERSAGRG
jgi:hypothetical protein